MDISLLRERRDSAAFTVTELNNYIKSVFENNKTLSSVTVKGEISNYKSHPSGHLYFSLKDSEGQIRAVMFRSRAATLKFIPESGMKVIVTGSVTVYPRDGSYQIYISTMQPDGIGALYLAYEQLKARLEAEGLFSQEYKKAIPRFPERIGVITSPSGAAVQDIINVTGRRFPSAKVYVYPALVQGEGAEASLVRALDELDSSALCDVIIIGRGGGSIEDLWAFNGETLARRIFSARTPVISAVGHETDFTICDFVSDMRAPTPSAAAEIAVPDTAELLMRLDSLALRAGSALKACSLGARERLSGVIGALRTSGLERYFERKREQTAAMLDGAIRGTNDYLLRIEGRLSVAAERLRVMNPLAVLSRGYSVAQSVRGVVRSVEDVSVGDGVSLVLADGSLDLMVNGKTRRSDDNG